MVDWTTLCFWTADMMMSFLTAFEEPGSGKLVWSMRRIALRYLKGAFVMDLVIVGVDWAGLVAHAVTEDTTDSSLDSAPLFRMFKILRVARVLRTLRLLRVARVQHLMYTLQEKIDSEWMSIFFGTLQNMGILLTTSHYIACIWYLIGRETTGADSWVDFYGARDIRFIEKYVLSLHWSLTQFTPAGMHVNPRNLGELCFAVSVILVAMIGFSTFVSSITASMTRLRQLQGNALSGRFMLRRFLKENGISKNLQYRTERYVQIAMDMNKRKLGIHRVELLNYLSGPLHVELQRELYEPYLLQHPFFELYTARSPISMCRLCFSAVKKSYYAKSDVILTFGSEADSMLRNPWIQM